MTLTDEQLQQIELKTERQRQLIESAQYQAYIGIRPEDVQVLITALREERISHSVTYSTLQNSNKKLSEVMEKLRVAEEFILWLTPCGQLSEAPTINTIGNLAREALTKLRGVKE